MRRNNWILTESDDIDTPVQRVRDAFDVAVNEAEELSDQARESVEDAIDDLEQRIESLRSEE
ncbi:hypothetical protein OB919_05220 [Halobacteria archaeon AArc-curdl1]|uniref:Uncharacterized protein n=1 Tax=Natronosalvus hydrolyticus TaxID=2979988 RepID=A0AAP2Z8K5_9EURY|nr:hypothetical protein [Halobacteria archaeon AArc-curdl1]